MNIFLHAHTAVQVLLLYLMRAHNGMSAMQKYDPCGEKERAAGK